MSVCVSVCLFVYRSLCLSLSDSRCTGPNILTSVGKPTYVAELQTDGNGLAIPEFEREDVYAPVKAEAGLSTKPK